jgi:hypothetical protein
VSALLAGAAWLAAAACLAAAPHAFDGALRSALVLAPFMLVAGLPGPRPRPAWRAPAVMLPLLAVAATVDCARGVAPGAAAGLAAQGLALVLLLADGARRAARTARARGAYGALWTAGVLAAPLLAAIAGWGAGPGSAPAALRGAAALSPLGWALDTSARAGALAAAPLAFALVLWTVAAALGRGEPSA